MLKKEPRLMNVLLRLGSLIFPIFALFILISTFQATRAAGEGYALEFDGVSDYVKFSDPLGQIIGPTWYQTKTVSVWVKPTSAAPQVNNPILGELVVGDFPRWFGIYWANSDGQDKFWVINFTTVDNGDGTFTPVSAE
ncbi:MAG TPA: hypothetical protein EYP41_22250, partial [Anaerolineae bacterium]|nr:hypothetical protein [Anaerolineae bacterium]